jgi:hypothetical protein
MIDKQPHVWTYRSGREVCPKTAAGRREYQRRLEVMVVRQRGLCCLCGRPMVWPTFEHQDGRGMGAGHRDDRIEIDGKAYNGAACLSCNGAKGSKRTEYHTQA